MHTAIISGSFDPITVGHLDLIKRSSALFGKVVVAVCVNAEKKSFLPLEKRVEAVKLSVKDIHGVDVELCDGLLADFCKKYENPVIIRGARNGTDFDYERQLSEINKKLGVPETVVLPAASGYSHISSSCAREMIKYNKNYREYLPEAAYKVIESYLKGE